MENSSKLTDIFPLPEEAKRLALFIGDWSVKGNLTLGGNSFNVQGNWKFTSAAAGWGVVNVGKLSIEGLGSYEEVDIIGFDPGEKLYHIFAVTNTAATHDHRGKWGEDNTLCVVYEGLQEGKKYREEIEIKILGSNEFAVNEKDILDGKVISTMNVFMRK
jgi:hypothetical protein